MTTKPPRRRWVITQGRLRISSDMSAAEIEERMREYYGRLSPQLDIPPAPSSPPEGAHDASGADSATARNARESR